MRVHEVHVVAIGEQQQHGHEQIRVRLDEIAAREHEEQHAAEQQDRQGHAAEQRARVRRGAHRVQVQEGPVERAAEQRGQVERHDEHEPAHALVEERRREEGRVEHEQEGRAQKCVGEALREAQPLPHTAAQLEQREPDRFQRQQERSCGH